MRTIWPAYRFRATLLLALGLAFGASACENSPTEPTPDPGATFTVDATSTTSWVLVDLGSSAQLVPASDPAASSAWDLGFQTTKVMVNGGANGPGGMVVHCICQNAGATPEQVMAMTPDSELPEFEAITRNQIPAAGADWSAAVFTEKPWYRYNLTGSDHQIWPTYETYLVKRGDEVFKVQLTGYYNAAGDARHITFRYAKLTG